MIKFIRVFFFIFSFSIVFQSCQKNEIQQKPKYVFLFIGDGMGVAQVNLTEAYFASIKNEKGFKHLSFTKLPNVGLVSTFANNRFITCSAAAGTAFATGNKTNINRISTDSTGKVPFKSIATICKEHGMRVGILTSVSIDHATPAVFYAHDPSRNDYFQIDLDLANSDFDFFGGGGLKSPDGQLNGEKINVIELAKKNGFNYVETKADFENLSPSQKDEKVIAVYPELIDGAAMPYAIDNPDGPTLADFTAKAIQLLYNKNGFFMMVEGGKIDWACHKNDAASTIYETMAFDEAIQVALDFYQKHPQETLIVVTADHETGGLSLGNQKNHYQTHLGYLKNQKISYEKFNEIISEFRKTLTGNFDKDNKALFDLIEKYFGLGKEIPITESERSTIWFAFEKSQEKPGVEKHYNNDFLPITKTVMEIISEKAGVGWTTYDHTGIEIPIYSIGPGSELFSKTIDNTDIPKITEKQLGFEEKEKP